MGKKTSERRAAKEKLTVSLPPASTDNSVIVWSFEKIDRNGEFAFDLNRKDFNVEKVFQKILEFSTMKWCELIPSDERKSRHHLLKNAVFSKIAESRIRALGLEEKTDSFYSFALDNVTRLIGIRNGAICQVVWYDAKHEFCPSPKKHT